MMGVLLFTGQAIGAIVLTHWADVFGRKKTMMFHGSIYALLMICSTYAQTLTQVYIYIFFIGLLFVPRSACIFTYIMEVTPDKYHENMTLAVYLGDGITFVISGVFVMYTRDVYMFLLILGVGTIVSVLFLAIFLHESPRFLYSKRRYEELTLCLKHIQHANRVEGEGLVEEMVDYLKYHK